MEGTGMAFTEQDLNNLELNPFEMIGSRWMLITAGTEGDFNSMTASWGGMGFLWNKNVVFIFIRPERYTYEFTEKYDMFSISFFEERYRAALYYGQRKREISTRSPSAALRRFIIRAARITKRRLWFLFAGGFISTT